MDTLLQDIRYGARLLRRNPVFALTAALSLAIGIGANTTIFTVANALLLRAAPGVTEPDRLVDIGGSATNSYPTYLDIRRRAQTLNGVYAYPVWPSAMSLAGPQGAERIFGNVVTANYFTVLGASPAVGRLFEETDDPAAGATVVLSHRFWTRHFEKDPGVVGRTLRLNGHPFTVIGVAAERFQGTTIVTADLWTPITSAGSLSPETGAELADRAASWLRIGGRLKPGVTASQAAAELDVIARALQQEYPGQYPDQNRRGLRLSSSSLVPGVKGPLSGFLALLMVIVSLVLIAACTNLAGVLLARATARRREIAVRVATGAGRARLVRQLLTETMMVFVLGGAAGLLLARWMTSALTLLLPTLPFPVDVSFALDGRVMAFTAGLSLVASVLCGLAPALHASSAPVVDALKDESQGPARRSRLRNAFVIAQVALSIVLVVVGGLFTRALHRAGSVDLGFDPQDVELATIDFSLAGYSDVTGPPFARELIDRVRRLPAVKDASLARVPPGAFEGLGLGGVTVPGAAPHGFDADWNIVSPGYFSTLRIPLVAGRDFSAADSAGAQLVAIVSETTARRIWPGQDAVGRFLIQQAGHTARTLLVVGVSHDLKFGSVVDGAPGLFVYVPLPQQYLPEMTIVARSTGGRRVARDIRALVASMNPNLPVIASQTLEDGMALGLVPQRVAAFVSGSLGFVGALLAAIGIYGVTAYTVARRTREIGIRMALGASRTDVARIVLRQGMSLVLSGAVIGLIIAAGAGRLLSVVLAGLPVLDPFAFGGSGALFVAIGLAACYTPVRRAIRIGAMEALRSE